MLQYSLDRDKKDFYFNNRPDIWYLATILEGKRRKVCARILFETLVSFCTFLTLIYWIIDILHVEINKFQVFPFLFKKKIILILLYFQNNLSYLDCVNLLVLGFKELWTCRCVARKSIQRRRFDSDTKTFEWTIFHLSSCTMSYIPV